MDKKQQVIVIAVVVNEKGEILMPKRHQPDMPAIHDKWELPGGKIEFGEDPETAVVREVKEETGLDVRVVRLLPKIYSNVWERNGNNENYQVLLLSYECKIISGTLSTGDPKISDLKYFKPENIDYPNSLPLIKEILALLKS